jgi:hypothetical protein
MKLLLPVLIALALSSCISLTKSGPSTTGEYLNSPENFILLDNTRTEALTTQYFFCWIPVGGKSEETLMTECFDKMLKSTGADGVFMQTYVMTRIRYPFYAVVKVELSGRPYMIRLTK